MRQDLLLTEIHVWQAYLTDNLIDSNMELLNRQFSCLDSEEQERAQKFYFTKDKVKFIQGRYLLKSIIANYLEKDIKKIQFKYNEYGKPELISNKKSLYFNISHSNNFMVMAFSKKDHLGIDVEFNDQQDVSYLISSNIFTNKELSYFDNLDSQEKQVVFYKLWTSKEAYLKALGVGLSISLNDIEVRSSKENAALRLIDDKTQNNSYYSNNRYYLKELENIPVQYLGMLAIPESIFQVKYLNCHENLTYI